MITPAPVRDRIATTRSSSALSTAVPVAGSASTSSPLAAATPSMPPTSSVWAWPTTVTTPMSGRAISHSWLMWPNPRMPISRISTSVSSGALRIVTGRPCSLLKLRSLAVVRRPAPHAAAIRSFADVLPTLPVTPTTWASSRRRAHCRERQQRLRRVGDLDRRTIAAERRRARCVRCTRRAPLAGGADELVAVAFGDDRNEQLAGRASSANRTRRRRSRRRGRSGVRRCPQRPRMHESSQAPTVPWADDRPATSASAFISWCCSAASRPNTTCRARPPPTSCGPPIPSATASRRSASPPRDSGRSPTRPSTR